MSGVLANHSDNIVMFDVPQPYKGVRGIDAYRETWPPFWREAHTIPPCRRWWRARVPRGLGEAGVQPDLRSVTTSGVATGISCLTSPPWEPTSPPPEAPDARTVYRRRLQQRDQPAARSRVDDVSTPRTVSPRLPGGAKVAVAVPDDVEVGAAALGRISWSCCRRPAPRQGPHGALRATCGCSTRVW
jgi:hypothetical protein